MRGLVLRAVGLLALVTAPVAALIATIGLARGESSHAARRETCAPPALRLDRAAKKAASDAVKRRVESWLPSITRDPAGAGVGGIGEEGNGRTIAAVLLVNTSDNGKFAQRIVLKRRCSDGPWRVVVFREVLRTTL